MLSGEWVRVPSDALPARRPGPVASAVAAPGLDEARRDRVVPRAGALVDDPADTDADESVPEPVEPAEPVVSATATGTEAIAEPTPNATASAPTRPI